MAQTAIYNFQKPSGDKNVDEEFYQLQETLDLLDSILAALQTAVNAKSALGHTHAISDVINLASELAAKMPASQTFKLDDLTDVSGADGAPNNYILVKSALGWLPSSALAALGTHGHLISEITGLVDALSGKADAAATAAALAGKANSADVYTKAADPIPMAKSPPRLLWVNGTTVTVKANKCRDELDAVNLVFPSDINVVLAGAPTTAHRHVLVGYDAGGNPAAVFSTTDALPGGWQAYRRAGSVRTNGSGGIIEFIQRPDDRDLFDLAVPLSAFNGTGSSSYVDLTLPAPPNVLAKLIMNANAGTNAFFALLPKDVSPPGSLSATAWNMMSILTSGYAGGEYSCRADANSQIQHGATSGAAYRIYLMGWRDRRGRDK